MSCYFRYYCELTKKKKKEKKKEKEKQLKKNQINVLASIISFFLNELVFCLKGTH